MPNFPEDVTVPFGVFKGQRLSDILANNPRYLDWLNGIEITSDHFRDAVREMNSKYAAEIERDIEEGGNAIEVPKLPTPPKVYTLRVQHGKFILTKPNGLRFAMKGSAQEAKEQAEFVCEAEDATLHLIGIPPA